jgi:hypothetical protein
VFSVQIFQENTFLKTKPNFPLTGKYFSLTNFPNDKQTYESLKKDFSKKKIPGNKHRLNKFFIKPV